MDRFKRGWQRTPSTIRKPLVLITGLLVMICGAILIPLPGPGWLIVFLGLALLSTEFIFAKRIKEWGEQRFKQAAHAALKHSKRLSKK